MAHLLDVNFLISLAWPNHIAHRTAAAWFLRHKNEGFATCPITEAGFVRVSMNPLVVSEHVTMRAALDMLESYTTKFPHIFWPDNLRVNEAFSVFPAISGHKQITAMYLLALAVSNDGTLVTLDAGTKSAAPPQFENYVVLVEDS